MQEIMSVADKIVKCSEALSIEGRRSEELIKAKAEAAAAYDTHFAIATTTLKAEGQPTTLIPKLAAGKVADYLLKTSVAEESLKAHYSKLVILQSQLSAYQSIFRHLEYTSRNTNGV